MVVKSSTVCCAEPRASKTLNGPTILGIEKPGIGKLKLKPNVCRFTVWLRSVTEPSTLGKNAARASLTCVSDTRTDWSASATRALPSGVSAISTARFKVKCITPCARASGAQSAKTSATTGRIPFIFSVTPFGYRRAKSGCHEAHRPLHQRITVREVAYAIGYFGQDSSPQHGVGHNTDGKLQPPQQFRRRQIRQRLG